MIFTDSIFIYKADSTNYFDDNAKLGELMTESKCLVEQISEFNRANGFDDSRTTLHVYLMPNDDMRAINYELEGLFVKLSMEESAKVYRILPVEVGRKILTNHKVSHIELDVEEVNL